MLKRIYFDANASAPLLAEARDAAVAALNRGANASSVHAEGRAARAEIEKARGEVAASGRRSTHACSVGVGSRRKP